MRSLSKRQTRFDRLVEDGAQGALRPSCPTDEAINPNRQTGSQRKERSTPTVRLMSSGRSDQLQSLNGCPAGEGPTSNSNRRTWIEDGELRQIRRFDPRCLRRTNVNSASAAVPSWETGGERIILRSYPCNRDHAPRVSMVGNLGKSLTVQSLSRLGDRQKRACGAPFQNRRQVVHKT